MFYLNLNNNLIMYDSDIDNNKILGVSKNY